MPDKTYNPESLRNSTKRIIAVLYTLAGIGAAYAQQMGYGEVPEWAIYLYVGIPIGYMGWSVAKNNEKLQNIMEYVKGGCDDEL